MPEKASAKGGAKNSLKRKLAPEQIRDLDITIGFLEKLVQRDPLYVEAWQLLGDDYTRRGRYNDGLKVDEQLSRLRPEDALVHYNLACSYTLTNDLQKALASLDRAITLGYRDFAWLARDPDLRKLRKHPAYEDIHAKVEKLKIHIS